MLFNINVIEQSTNEQQTLQEHGSSVADVRQFMEQCYPWLTITSIAEVCIG